MKKFTVTAIIVLATLTAMTSITKPEPQKFLRKYHEITDKNLSKFMEEWPNGQYNTRKPTDLLTSTP